jgi:predicted nucleic acid-binding protein
LKPPSPRVATEFIDLIVVDTNVLVYLLLDGPATPSARALLQRDADWHSEAFIMVELTNVLCAHVRQRRMAFSHAQIALETALEVMNTGLHMVSHIDALELAAAKGVSGYDARFLALANQMDGKLVTEDLALRRAAPQLTRSLQDALET